MSDLTISQALRSVSKLKGQLKDLRERAQLSVSYREDAEPAFEFPKLVEQINSATQELISLETYLDVAKANTTVTVDGETMPLTKAVRLLQEFRGLIAWYKGLTVKARTTTSETEYDYDDEGKRVSVARKWVCKLPEATKVQTVDDLQDKFDRLNDAVEKVNNATLIGRVR